MAFETEDAPTIVLRFYQQHLPNQGWQLRGTHPSGLIFSVSEGSQVYDLFVTTEILSSELTRVQVWQEYHES
jgi:hypothetical protein